MADIDFQLEDIPEPEKKPIENEYTPLVDQLVGLGLDSGKEFRAVFADEDAAAVARQKFQRAARGRGVSSYVKARGLKDKEKGVALGFSIREKITRPRKPAQAE